MCLLKWNQNSKREGVSHFSEQCERAVCTGDEDLKNERAFSRVGNASKDSAGGFEIQNFPSHKPV